MPKDELKTEKASKKEASDKSDKKKAKTPAKSSGKSKDQKKQPNKVVKYFKDLKSEFKKVVWPTKQQVINNTPTCSARMFSAMKPMSLPG